MIAMLPCLRKKRQRRFDVRPISLGKIEVFVPGPSRFWPSHLGEPPVAQVETSPRSGIGRQVLKVPVSAELLAAGDHNGSTYFQHVAFSGVARGGCSDPEVGLDDGRWSVLMGLAAQVSMSEGRCVSLSDFV